jgi:hypothetical protein
LSKIAKYSAAILLVLLTMMALTTVLTAFAQDEEFQPPPEEATPPQPGQYPPNIPLPTVDTNVAYVTVVAAVGGTTSPAPGQYQYPTSDPTNPATYFNITAVPFHGYRFLYWQISGSYTSGHNLPPVLVPEVIPEDYVPTFPSPATAGWDSLVTSQNPLNVICGYGYNFQYQPVFQLITPQSAGNDTIVIMLDAVGGTTNPGVGTHTYHQDTLTLTATPNSGYEFKYWTATGLGDNPGPNQVILDNPADISCQTGYTYQYQPVFVPTGATTGEPGIDMTYVYAAIIVLVIIAVIGIAAALMYRSRAKK